MAPTIQQVMEGIEGRLLTISGLRARDYTPGQINPPQAIVGVPPIPRYHVALAAGKFDLAPTITILVSGALDRVGQHKLAGYADATGATSVFAAIEGDKTLGGIVHDTQVVDFRPLGLEEVGLIGYFGGVFTLRVMA